MKTTLWNLLFLTVVMALSTYNARSQVTIGGLTEPQTGALLDLNSLTKGGLLLPNIDIPDLSKIPATGFTGIDTEQEENLDLAGTIVYNTNTTTGPGAFLWCGHNWNRLGRAGALILLEDPGNVNPFPADGSKENHYTVDSHNCHQAGNFTSTWITGEKYIDQLSILDAGAGTFIVQFLPNDQAVPRHAVMLISDACGNSNTFVFKQDGDSTGCGTSPPVPTPQSGNSLTLCSGGAVYLHLDDHTDEGVYIWTLNGQEVGRGHDYVATKPGRYIVYADKIGCSNSKEVVVTASSAMAPEAPQRIIAANNGVVCGPTGTTELAVVAPSGSTVAWYKNSIKQTSLSGATIQADAGVWYAVVEDGNCSSLPSDKAYVYVDNSGNALPAPIIQINGQTGGNVRLCQSGSAYLEVVNSDVETTYTWYADNTQIGTGTGVYYQVPSGMPSVILRVRATGIGCASESNANVTIETGSAPAIPVIAGRSTLCGGNTTLSVNTPVSSPAVVWYKDGAVLSGETGISLAVTEAGNYSATVADNGCVSPMSAVRPVTLSDFSRLSWIKEPVNAFFGDQRTLEAAGTNGPLTYTWKIVRKSDGADLTSTIIKSGQGTQQILVEYPQASSPGSSEDFTISVHGVNACGADVTDPALVKDITLTDQCSKPQITYPVGTQNIDAVVGNMLVLNVAATGLNKATYEWYKGPKQGSYVKLSGEITATLIYTPTQSGTETFWCRVSNGCGVNYYADSPEFIITASQNPENMTVGSGSLIGKTCFDIVESNFGGICGMNSTRLPNKTNFASLPIQDKTYTFIANSSGTNFRFVVVDPEQVLDETTPYTTKNNFSGNTFVAGNTATIQLNFKTNLNSSSATPRIVGRASEQAATVKLYATWYTSPKDYSILLTIKIQDCACCGAMVSPIEWKAFMCHNLGADQSLPPFTPAKGLNGSYYKYGGPELGTDTYGRFLSPVADVNWSPTIKPPYFDSPLLYPTNSWNDNVKTPNDPCPPGYRVPTRAQWQGVLENNVITPTASNWSSSATNFASGVYIGSSLYLPASGYLHGNGGMLYNRGLEGRYWSTTYSRNTYGAAGSSDLDWIYFFFFDKSSKSVTDHYKSSAFPVRCIAE